jgi:hypothetical protein
MNDPKDKAMLFELAEDFMGEIIINEAQFDYNVRIRKALTFKRLEIKFQHVILL